MGEFDEASSVLPQDGSRGISQLNLKLDSSFSKPLHNFLYAEKMSFSRRDDESRLIHNDGRLPTSRENSEQSSTNASRVVEVCETISLRESHTETVFISISQFSEGSLVGKLKLETLLSLTRK